MAPILEQLRRAAMRADERTPKSGWFFEIKLTGYGVSFRGWAYTSDKREIRRTVDISFRDMDQAVIGIDERFDQFWQQIRDDYRPKPTERPSDD